MMGRKNTGRGASEWKNCPECSSAYTITLPRASPEHGYAPSVREDRRGAGAQVALHGPFPHQAPYRRWASSKRGAGKGRAITLKKQPQAVPVAPQPVEADDLASHRRQVPILGNVAAGNPILAQECIEDYLTFDTGGHDDEYFALRVRGESMLGVGILPDDLVVVHRQSIAQNGQIVVALLGDEATVKTLKRKGSEVWLLPANPDYQPIDGRECTILGRVVAVVRQY